jgi:hypothetical protein
MKSFEQGLKIIAQWARAMESLGPSATFDAAQNDHLGGITMDQRLMDLTAQGERTQLTWAGEVPPEDIFKDGLVPEITGVQRISGQELSLLLAGK